jgi:beta-lactamase regulating signal transducer with metallopeptidase domain
VNALLHWFAAPEWSQLVKTLLHSLWQGVLIAAALALVMRRVTNPHWRYRLAFLALVMIPASGILTWAALNSPTRSLPVPVVQPAPVETIPVAALSENPQTKLVLLASRSPASPPSSWTAWLALLWIVGTSAMLGRASVKLAEAERLRRSCQPLDNPQVTQLLAEARRAVGLAREVRVVVTDKLTSPAVVGVLVPTLVLPLTLVTTLTPEQIHFILLHELAHIRRGDYLANLFQFFIEAVLFFNPAVWWISHQVRREREASCDALAIELSGAPADYARTLVHVAESALTPSPVAAPAFGNEREPSSLADRVQRLLVPGYRPSLRLTWRAMIAAFVLGALLLMLCAEGTRVAVAQIAKPADEPARSSSTSPTTNASVLFTRTYLVDPIRVNQGMEDAIPGSTAKTNVQEVIRNFFATLGVDLDPPKRVFFNDRKGELVVQANKEELDVIESILQVLNRPIPQVNVKVRFVEVERGKPGADWYLGTIGNLSSTNPPLSGVASATVSNSGPQSFTGILTDPQFRVVLRDLEQRKGFSLLSEGEVTTLSGRQAQIQVVELSTIVNAASFPVPPLPGNTTTNSTSTNLYQTQVIPFGPVLDVIPTVAADGYTIQMTVIPTVTEFLGYDDPKKVLASSPVKSMDAETLPLPRMRIRQVSTSAAVWDGQTLVLGLGNGQVITKLPGGGTQKAKNPDAHDKQLLVFITPTIIDPAGNRANPDAESSPSGMQPIRKQPRTPRPDIKSPPVGN